MTELNDKEQAVHKLRSEGKTYQQIAKEVGLSWQRCRVIWKDAAAKLAQPVNEYRPMKISQHAVRTIRSNRSEPRMFDVVTLPQMSIEEQFRIPDPPPGVVPKGSRVLAMDDAQSAIYQTYAMGNAYSEGLCFMGYQYLAQLMQRSEYRRAVHILAEEMTRKGIKINATGEGEDKENKIKEIEAEFTRLKVMDNIRIGLEMDYTFGIGRIFIDMGDDHSRATPLFARKETISKGKKIKRLHPVEPMWVYPDFYDANDPLSPDFYRPSSWFVMSESVHDSRFLKFVSFPVPDILKPAYLFGGVSLTQIMKPYVDNWLQTRQDVQQIIHSFVTWILKTNMGGILNEGSAEAESNRAEVYTKFKTNFDLHMIDKETEDFDVISAPLGSLDKLQAQAQEHVCAAAGLPLVKYTGISPSGLNATSEFEMQCLNDHTAAEQEKDMRTNIQRILELVQLGLGYDVDPEITFEFVPLLEMSEKERGEIAKNEADANNAYIASGVLSPKEVRTALANQEESQFAGLDIDDVPEQEFDTEEDIDKAMDSVSLALFQSQIEKGMIAEQEHKELVSGDQAKILEIVLAHLKEDPEYYSKMEKAGLE